MDTDGDSIVNESEEQKKWSTSDENQWRIVSNIHYYLREGFYGTALQICDGFLRTSKDSLVSLYRGVCLTLLGKIPEATRALEQINDDEISLGSLYALKWAHSSAFNPDKQSLIEIETSISGKSHDEKCPSSSFAAAAAVLYFSGEYQKAKQLLDLARKKSNERRAEYYCLLGWIDLALGRNQKSTQELFEKAAGQGYPDGYIGRCRILEGYHSATEMKTVAKELTITSYQFVPGHIERVKSAIMLKEWNNAIDALQNSNVPDGSNAYIELLRTVHAICSAGLNGGLNTTLASMQKCLEDNEPDNHSLFGRIAGLLASLSGKDKGILTFARRIAAKALQISRKPEYLALGLRIAVGLAETKEVSSISKELMTLDCDDPFASLGTVLAMLMSGRIKDAVTQYEIIQAAHPKLEESALYYTIGAIIGKQSGKSSFDAFRQLIETSLDKHRIQVQSYPFGLKYFEHFQSDLLYLMVEQTSDFAPLVPIKSANDCLKLGEKILNLIIETAPALSHCTYQMAKIKYLGSNYADAEKFIKMSLDKNETFTEGYILKAQIIVDRGGKLVEAENALTTGLNFNFALRETSLYHFIKAKTLKKKNENEEAVKTLRAGLRLPVKEVTNNLLLPKEEADTHRISVQLELIDTLQIMKRTAEAEQAMNDAMKDWEGKPEQEQLIISQAQLFVTKGQADKALALLKKVQPGQANFHLSRVKMAEIYLEEKKDKFMFAACYRELLEVEPTPASYSILGDAFMSIQEPEEAIAYYEQALKMQNKDLLLAEKIGEAYVMSHLYTKAVNFYEASMNIYKDKKMRLRLAELLLKLRNFEKCERVLKQPLEQEPNPMDPEVISAHVQFLLLLSRTYQQKEQYSDAFDCMNKAKMMQLRLLNKNDTQTNTAVRREASRICCLLAELHMRRHDVSKATELYKEAVGFYENDIKMMADLLYLKNEGEQAIIHFMQLLTRNPNHYHALARVIELSWRIGDSEHAEKFLARAVEAQPRAILDAGYNYCKGLNEWFTGDPNGSLQAFNRARRDPEWGEKATYNMIEICLNPDNEIIGGEVMDQSDGSDDADRAMGTKTAEKFLKELRYKPTVDTRYTLMENFILIHTGNRNNINKALNVFLTMAGEGEPVANVGAVLGAARAYMLLKQSPKAKALLKRVLAHNWTLDDADYLEKCWLQLVDLYIYQSKTEQATKVLDLVLHHNASSIKAYECMGYLREKEQKYAEAYQHYEKAWRICKFRNPAIGYKLAYNYLKCKKFFASIETCHRVLEQFPNYPKIKKEILDKARMQIRT
ncbi:unnamed protein product [Caenorhabditis bovis]|uniref:Tetratricopeptide repeat protein 21B n=1 Tax=Caenorhabditis bovis TaxID=2654633 RepID=A0A8S1EUG4_9PELO|nr:unnamed protein product [Caenorhabditis bovis]